MRFVLGSFAFTFQPRPGAPVCPVLVISYCDVDEADCAEDQLWICFSFKQGMEGPAAFMMTNGGIEHVQEVSALLQASPLPANSPYGPFHYTGVEAVMHRSLFDSWARALNDNTALAERLQLLLPGLPHSHH